MGCAPSSSKSVVAATSSAPGTLESATDSQKAGECTPLVEKIDYSLIEDKLPRIDELLKYLREQEDYANQELLDQKLARLTDSFYSPTGDLEKFLQFSNYLAEHGIPALYTKIFHQCHNFDILTWKNEKDVLGLMGCYLATAVLWNTCDSSPIMCRNVGQAGIIELIVGDLRNLKEYAVAKKRDEYKDLYLESLLATLHNVIRLYIDNRGYFRDAGAVELLQHYLGMESVLYRAYALLTLSYIVNEDENHRINTGDENIEFLIKLLKSALETKDHREKEHSFHSTELVSGMTKLAVNDSNKVKFVELGVLPHLVKLLQPNCTLEEQRLAATTLWTLAFHKDNKNKILNEEGCYKALETLHGSSDPGLSKACDGALWELKGQLEGEKERSPKSLSSRGHVMISYNWDVQKRMIKVKERLKSAGYNVWMDIEKMGGSTLEAMADAVQNADVVLICMSEKYKYSNPCRSEAEYTYKLSKPHIPIRVQPNYNPDGWLGILVGTKIYYDFSTDEGLEKNFPGLVQGLGDRGKLSVPIVRKQEIQETAPPSGALPSSVSTQKGSVASWTNDDVIIWLKENELGHLAPKFKRYTGRKLLTLRKISLEAPEFFYDSIQNKLGFKDLYDIVSFKEALEEL